MGDLSKIDKCLTVSEIDIIRRSYTVLRAEDSRAGELFYQHLFRNKPELRELFAGEISALSETLFNMLGMIVSQIQNMPELLPMLSDLARRHIGYGVELEHYKDAGDALVSMLREILGPAFRPEVELAWTKAYDGIAETMVDVCFGDVGVMKYRAMSEI